MWNNLLSLAGGQLSTDFFERPSCEIHDRFEVVLLKKRAKECLASIGYCNNGLYLYSDFSALLKQAIKLTMASEECSAETLSAAAMEGGGGLGGVFSWVIFVCSGPQQTHFGCSTFCYSPLASIMIIL